MKTFNDYCQERDLQEGWLGRKVGNVAGWMAPIIGGGLASQAGMDALGPAFGSNMAGSGAGMLPGALAGGAGSYFTKLPILLGNLLSDLEDKFYGLFKKKKINASEPAYFQSMNLMLTNKNAADFKKMLDKLRQIMPDKPDLDKIPQDKRELAYRTWFHRTPYFNDKDQLSEIWSLAGNAIDYAKKMGFSEAVPNLETIRQAAEHRLQILDRAPPQEPQEITPPEQATTGKQRTLFGDEPEPPALKTRKRTSRRRSARPSSDQRSLFDL